MSEGQENILEIKKEAYSQSYSSFKLDISKQGNSGKIILTINQL